MQRHAAHARGVPSTCRPLLGAALCLTAFAVAGPARAEPPITSLQDAACRAEAKAKVFTIPDPLNLGLHEIGKQLYFGCMKRSTRPAPRRHHHRRRR